MGNAETARLVDMTLKETIKVTQAEGINLEEEDAAKLF
jgi:hypothetical protein